MLDMCLMAPPAIAIQEFPGRCYNFGIENIIIFNPLNSIIIMHYMSTKNVQSVQSCY